jgi:hypothetical protein
VSREVARHGGRPEYRAHEADYQAWESALRPKRCLLAINSKLQKIVASKLILDWSPEQVSGWLKIQYPDDESMRVSHETIYRSLFIQARGVLKKELIGHLRSKRRIRRSWHSRVSGQSRGQIVLSKSYPVDSGRVVAKSETVPAACSSSSDSRRSRVRQVDISDSGQGRSRATRYSFLILGDRVSTHSGQTAGKTNKPAFQIRSS